MRLTLSKFQPSEIKPHRTILLIGKRGTGKSVLLEDLLGAMRERVDFAMCFTPTQDSRDMFERHMPPSWVHGEFDEGKIDTLCSFQRTKQADRKRNVLLVLDDMMADKRVLKSTKMRDIFFNGRHEHVTYISSQQYCLDMPPDLRSNCDYVMVLKDNILANKQRLHKFFFGMFARFDDFSRVMDTVTANYGVLCLDNTCRTNKLSDMLSWYRASPEPGDFKLGKPIFWEMHARAAKSKETMATEREDAHRSRVLEERSKARDDRIVSVQRQDDAGHIIIEDVA
tara:strand:- start:56 stop:904 length:849 start_codon:yes stop_codon:yes gene_type:complete